MMRTPDGQPTHRDVRRRLRTGTGALALVLLAAGCGGGEDDPSPTASRTATVSTGTSPTPTNVAPVFTLHEDFFPVPQADDADIPWGEVGPGWFLVDAHARVDVDWSGDETSHRLPEAVGGLSLVSPEGEWYAARSFAGTGAAYSVHWAADGAWLLTNVDAGINEYTGDLVRLDLETGASASIAARQTEHIDYVGASGGVTLVRGFTMEVGGPYVVYTSEGRVSPECSVLTAHMSGDFRAALAPDGRTVVCWRWRSDGKTDVGTLDLSAPSAATYLDVFRLDMWYYEQLGWLSDDTFLFARLDDASKVDSYFVYNVGSRTVEDFTLPFAPGTGLKVEAFDYGAQAYVSSGWASDSIDVHRADGEKIATVPGGCADGVSPSWSLSGTRLMTSCRWDAGAVTIIDLETGEVLGSWPYGSELSVTANGYPQHAN